MNDTMNRSELFNQPPSPAFQSEALAACDRAKRTVFIYLPNDDVWFKLPELPDTQGPGHSGGS